MEFPIYAYGNNILKTKTTELLKNFPKLDMVICNMWETMEKAHGCGLAAPQIGKSIQLFIVDTKVLFDNMNETERNLLFAEGDNGIREVFINTKIVNQSEEKWEETEACLSLPFLSGKVVRSWSIEVQYQNQHFETIKRKFSGMTARVILHEYDHTQGVLYIDHLKKFSRKLMEGKLKKIYNGKVERLYKMKFQR